MSNIGPDVASGVVVTDVLDPATSLDIIHDSSGAGHNGVLHAADGNNKSVVGHAGRAIEFDGQDDWLTLKCRYVDGDYREVMHQQIVLT